MRPGIFILGHHGSSPMRTRQSHNGPICPVCGEPTTTHSLDYSSVVHIRRRSPLAKAVPAYVRNGSGRRCFEVLA